MSWEAAQRACCLAIPGLGKSGPLIKAVLCVLAGHADKKTGRCFLGMERIAAEACCSENAARRATQALDKLGAIQIVRSAGRMANVYEVNTTWSPPANPPATVGLNPPAMGGLKPVNPPGRAASTLPPAHANPPVAGPQQDHEQDHEQSGAASASPSALAGRAAPVRSEIISGAARASPSPPLRGSGRTHNGIGGPHEHEARQGPSAPPVRNGHDREARPVGAVLPAVAALPNADEMSKDELRVYLHSRAKATLARAKPMTAADVRNFRDRTIQALPPVEALGWHDALCQATGGSIGTASWLLMIIADQAQRKSVPLDVAVPAFCRWLEAGR